MSSSPQSPIGSPPPVRFGTSTIAALGHRAVFGPLLVLTLFELFVVGIGGGYLSDWLGFPYGALSLVSLVVYICAGFVARRGGGPPALAGGLIALVESGMWAGGIQVGPQPGPAVGSGPTGILAGMLFTIASGMLFAMLGGLLAARRPN